jgi:hypothetical protein
LFLICERFKGKESYWSAYINILPSNYSIPLYWSEHHKLLVPKTIQPLIKQQLGTALADFSKLRVVCKKICSHQPQMKNAFCWEKFAWAWSTVNTRSVFLKTPAMADMNHADCLALIPYLDLFNHSSTARVSMFRMPNVNISIVSFSIKYFTTN